MHSHHYKTRTPALEENTGGQSRDPADESPDPSAEEDTSDESSAEETEYNDDGSISAGTVGAFARVLKLFRPAEES